MNYKFFIYLLSCLFFTISCGLYKPLASPKTDLEYVQEGQSCLHDQNYACALNAYAKISDTDLKNEKVCVAYLTQAGVSLSAIVNTVASQVASAAMLGSLSRSMMPWTSDKETASVNAITECDKLSTISDTSKAAMLRIFAYLADCGIRVAKTDQWVATSEVAGSCNADTAGNRDGTLAAADIVESQGVALSSSNSGMCKYDVTQCLSDLSTTLTLQSGLSSGLSRIADNLIQIPTALANTGTTTNNARVEIINTL